MQFSLYFLGQNVKPEDVPDDPRDRIEWTFMQPVSLSFFRQTFMLLTLAHCKLCLSKIPHMGILTTGCQVSLYL